MADRAPGRALLGIVALLCGHLADAHEIGTSRVKVVLRTDSTFVVDVDLPSASALGEEYRLIRSLTSAEGARRREAFRSSVVGGTALRFDGVRVVPEATVVDAPPGPTVHLTGRIPTRAREVRWSSELGYSTYALTFQNQGDPAIVTQWLAVGEESRPFVLDTVSSPEPWWPTCLLYAGLGFTHIVPGGFDHVLFVLGLFLLSTRLRPILVQVSCFTIAHSVSLALTAYGVVSLAPRVVEPLIALSIAYVAAENILVGVLKPWRAAVVFGFGLLHGMGFAGALAGLRLPRTQLLTALFTFNLGVEAGQLAVIAVAYLALGVWFGGRPWYRARVVVPASAAIAITGACWTVTRLLG